MRTPCVCCCQSKHLYPGSSRCRSALGLLQQLWNCVATHGLCLVKSLPGCLQSIVPPPLAGLRGRNAQAMAGWRLRDPPASHCPEFGGMVCKLWGLPWWLGRHCTSGTTWVVSSSSYTSYMLYTDGTQVTLWQLHLWFVERMTQHLVQFQGGGGAVLVSNTTTIMTVLGAFVEQELLLHRDQLLIPKISSTILCRGQPVCNAYSYNCDCKRCVL